MLFSEAFMQFENYTDRAKGFIQAAQGIAVRENHQQFTPEHILKALLDDSEGLAANLIRSAGGRPDDALRGVELALGKVPKVQGGGQLYMGPGTAKVFATTEDLAKKAKDQFVTAERLLTALAIEPEAATSKILKDAGVTAVKLNEAINGLRKGRTADTASAEQGYDALKRYARDLTDAARAGKLDPASARPPSRRASRSASSMATCPKASRTRSFSPWTWAP
jgi:ATP-dependent Clp protease ATP-binding subunit ClpB